MSNPDYIISSTGMHPPTNGSNGATHAPSTVNDSHTNGSFLDVKISIFNGVTGTTPVDTDSLRNVLAAHCNGTYRHRVEAIRKLRTEGRDHKDPEVKRAKEKLLAPTFAGNFSYRDKENKEKKEHKKEAKLIEASGIAILDFDELKEQDIDIDDARTAMGEDPYVAFIFTTTSGLGLRVGVRIPVVKDAEEYKRRWYALASYIAEKYELRGDLISYIECLSFVSYDPDLWINEDAVPFEGIVEAGALSAPPPGPIPEMTSHRGIEGLKLSLAERNLIRKGVDVGERSEALGAVYTVLARAGCKPEETLAIVTDPQYGISAKPLEKGRKWTWDDIHRVLAKSSSDQRSEQAKDEKTGAQEEEPRSLVGYHWSDTGNMERFATQHKDDIRWVHEWKSWMVWNGSAWRRDTKKYVVRLARKTLKAMRQATAGIADEKMEQKWLKFCANSEASARINAMIDLAKSCEGISVDPQIFDDPARTAWFLPCKNGVLDLRTGELRKTQRADYLTKIIPFDYNPEAECPTWLAFLDTILCGNAQLVNFIQRATGYSLTGRVQEKAMFILHGASGDNGKSTFLETLQRVIGSEFATKVPKSVLLGRDRGGVPNDVAKLAGRRFVTTVEPQADEHLKEAQIKEMTGGDTMTARPLYGEFFDFPPTFKVWMATNHRPEVRGTDDAIWRRLKLIPFDKKIPEDQQDKEMDQKLAVEAEGILAWMVEGCFAWQREGLNPPDEVTVATSEYRAEMDALGRFLDDACVVGNTAFRVQPQALYDAYLAWCTKQGEEPITQTKLRQELDNRGFERGWGKALGKSYRCWLRIGLLETSQEENDDTARPW